MTVRAAELSMALICALCSIALMLKSAELNIGWIETAVLAPEPGLSGCLPECYWPPWLRYIAGFVDSHLNPARSSLYQP